MPSHQLARKRVPCGRRQAVAGVTLLAYLAASIGVPLPTGVAKDLSRPFPCQHHSCGCLNAEQCWQRCCCFTRDQRLAWAHEHDVIPPAPVPDGDSPRQDGSRCPAANW